MKKSQKKWKDRKRNEAEMRTDEWHRDTGYKVKEFLGVSTSSFPTFISKQKKKSCFVSFR